MTFALRCTKVKSLDWLQDPSTPHWAALSLYFCEATSAMNAHSCALHRASRIIKKIGRTWQKQERRPRRSRSSRPRLQRNQKSLPVEGLLKKVFYDDLEKAQLLQKHGDKTRVIDVSSDITAPEEKSARIKKLGIGS